MSSLLLFLCVAAGAMVFGMAGLGGGLLYVPLLSWWGMDFLRESIPLSLLLGSATGAFPAVHYLRAGLVDLRTAAAAVLTVLLGAPLGAAVSQAVPVSTLKVLFAVAAAGVALRILLTREPHPHQRPRPAVSFAACLGAGLLAGFASGLLGIGGGFVMVPALLTLGYPTRESVAISSLVVTFSTLSGFLSHLPAARLHVPTILLLVPAAALGAFCGGWWAARGAPAPVLRRLVAGLLILVSLRVLWEGLVARP